MTHTMPLAVQGDTGTWLWRVMGGWARAGMRQALGSIPSTEPITAKHTGSLASGGLQKIPVRDRALILEGPHSKQGDYARHD